MTIDEVRAAVSEIVAVVHDDEVAHGMEDHLRESVLRAIALGAVNAPELAAEALRTRDVEFARWCS